MNRLLLIAMACLVLSAARAFPCDPYEPSAQCKSEPVEVSDQARRQADTFRRDIERGRLRERTNGALNAIIRFGAFKLKQKGYDAEAKQILGDWETKWDGYIVRAARDLGDHRPLSQWLADVYKKIEGKLGPDICHALRLDDIKILNYGIPVVFSCVDDVDEAEFGRHFVPFSGTVIYWTSFFVCVGGTWGTGFFFCGPIAMGCEFLTERWIAPKLNPRVWNLSCH